MTLTETRRRVDTSLPLLAVGFALVELAFSGRYGYHRDELYFMAIGGHPAFGYVDEPPLVPMLLHAVDALSGHSLFWLRVPAALSGALVVLVTGRIAREFGAGRAAQLLAAGSMAVSAMLVQVAHFATTTTFDLLSWTVLSWLVVRALRDGGRAWLLVGLAAGVALEIKTLPLFLLFALVVGLLVAGPRSALVSRWLLGGTAVALALWAPNLIWQATHGWPQLQISSAIAAGHTGSAQPRWAFLPYQFLLISPPLAAVWLAGLWRLFRDPSLRVWRCVAVAYPVLVILFVATGGKPYYLAGMYPVLLAAGAQPTLVWLRGKLLWAVLGLSAAVSAVLMLPVVPVGALHDTPVVAINYDAGEMVGWPAFVSKIEQVYEATPRAVVLADNYGEAGAMRRFAPSVPVYSPHLAMYDLATPPAATRTVVAVGFTEATLAGWFADVRPVATIDNGVHLDNDEQGDVVYVCTTPLRPWSVLWPAMKRLA